MVLKAIPQRAMGLMRPDCLPFSGRAGMSSSTVEANGSPAHS